MSELSKSYMINRIAELVEENESLRESQSSTHKTMMQLNDNLINKNAEIKELRNIVRKDTKDIAAKEQQLLIIEKALELACNDLYWLCAFSGKFTKEEFIKHKIDLYIKKAKEKR